MGWFRVPSVQSTSAHLLSVRQVSSEGLTCPLRGCWLSEQGWAACVCRRLSGWRGLCLLQGGDPSRLPCHRFRGDQVQGVFLCLE